MKNKSFWKFQKIIMMMINGNNFFFILKFLMMMVIMFIRSIFNNVYFIIHSDDVKNIFLYAFIISCQILTSFESISFSFLLLLTFIIMN